MWHHLIVNEEPKSVDVIIVISGDTGRIEHGVQLYQSGYAPKILFSGYDAERITKQLQKWEIPEDDIITENRSFSTFTNAKYSLEIMKTQGFKSAIVVTSPYHTRRTSVIFKHFFKGLDLKICSVPYDSSISTTWWKNKHMTSRVIAEYLKFTWYYIIEQWLH